MSAFSFEVRYGRVALVLPSGDVVVQSDEDDERPIFLVTTCCPTLAWDMALGDGAVFVVDWASHRLLPDAHVIARAALFSHDGSWGEVERGWLRSLPDVWAGRGCGEVVTSDERVFRFHLLNLSDGALEGAAVGELVEFRPVLWPPEEVVWASDVRLVKEPLDRCWLSVAEEDLESTWAPASASHSDQADKGEQVEAGGDGGRTKGVPWWKAAVRILLPAKWIHRN